MRCTERTHRKAQPGVDQNVHGLAFLDRWASLRKRRPRAHIGPPARQRDRDHRADIGVIGAHRALLSNWWTRSAGTSRNRNWVRSGPRCVWRWQMPACVSKAQTSKMKRAAMQLCDPRVEPDVCDPPRPWARAFAHEEVDRMGLGGKGNSDFGQHGLAVLLLKRPASPNPDRLVCSPLLAFIIPATDRGYYASAQANLDRLTGFFDVFSSGDGRAARCVDHWQQQLRTR